MNDIPLYERDPAAYEEHLREGNVKQPRKRVGADALIRDLEGDILIVKPSYKPGWDLPGGMSEANEPPLDTVRRELREELSLELSIGRMLCVDWVAPHGPWDDLVAMVFDGGVVADPSMIRLDDTEITQARFVPLAECNKLLRPRMIGRTIAAHTALSNGTVQYLQNGEPAALLRLCRRR